MRLPARLSLVALVAGAIAGISAPAAQAAFGVSKFESLSCKENAPEGEPGECNAGTPAQFFTQAGGHPNFGITDFTFNEFGTAGNGVKTIRIDLPVGFSTNPQALPLCSMKDFEANLGKAEASHCPASSEAGVQEITVALPGPTLVTLTGTVYNLEPAFGLPLEFGIDIPLPSSDSTCTPSWKAASAGTRKQKPPKRGSRRATTTSTSRSKSRKAFPKAKYRSRARASYSTATPAAD